MSPPAEKARPSPVTMTARMSSSPAIFSSASRISSRIGPPNAFNFSGRLSLIVAIESAVERIIVCYIKEKGLAARGVADLHLFKLFILNLHRQTQNGFNRPACLGLKLGGCCILFENRAAETDVPFFVGLYAFPIELRSRSIAGGLAKLNELLVFFQCERLARELCGADAFDCRFETFQKLEHRAVTIRRRIESA